VAICCPPILVNSTSHFAHHFLRHSRGLLRHWHHLHIGVRIAARIAVGATCMACPATAIIPPLGAPPYVPLNALITPPPGIFTPGQDNTNIPPAWGVGPIEEALSPSPEVGAFPGAIGFLPPESASFPIGPSPEGEFPGASPIDTESFPVITTGAADSDCPVHEPAGLWTLAIGLGGLVGTRFGRCPGRARSL
jgi:hypothetical protein